MHGIGQDDLFASGLAPEQVAAALNVALGPGGVAWCDGGAYDAHWADALFKAAGAVPTFVLGEWSRVLAQLDPEARGRHRAWLEQTPAPHRADADAARLLLALAHAAGFTPIPVQAANASVLAAAAAA